MMYEIREHTATLHNTKVTIDQSEHTSVTSGMYVSVSAKVTSHSSPMCLQERKKEGLKQPTRKDRH